MHFMLYQDRAGLWRWRLIAANKKIIADSAESYSSKAKAEAGIALVQKGAGKAEVRAQ